MDLLDRPPVEKTLGSAIVHLATHAMHHRAPLMWMYRKLGLNGIPGGDALTWEQTVGSDRWGGRMIREAPESETARAITSPSRHEESETYPRAARRLIADVVFSKRAERISHGPEDELEIDG